MTSTNIKWETVYKNRATPWDFNKPHSEVVNLVKKKTIKPCRVLELGCGYGNDAIFLAKNGFDVTAIDISKLAVKAAKERARKQGARIKFLVDDATDLRSVPGEFSFVLDVSTFHFVPKEKRTKYLERLRKHLSKKGLYLLIVSSDKDPVVVLGPYRFSKDDIRQIFEKYFEILSMRLVTLKEHTLRPKIYVCLMKKK